MQSDVETFDIERMLIKIHYLSQTNIMKIFSIISQALL